MAASIEQQAIRRVVAQHHETVQNLQSQEQKVESIIADMQSHSQGAMVTACVNMTSEWRSHLKSVGQKLSDMAELVANAAKQTGSQDDAAGESVTQLTSSLGSVGGFLSGLPAN